MVSIGRTIQYPSPYLGILDVLAGMQKSSAIEAPINIPNMRRIAWLLNDGQKPVFLPDFLGTPILPAKASFPQTRLIALLIDTLWKSGDLRT